MLTIDYLFLVVSVFSIETIVPFSSKVLQKKVQDSKLIGLLETLRSMGKCILNGLRHAKRAGTTYFVHF